MNTYRLMKMLTACALLALLAALFVPAQRVQAAPPTPDHANLELLLQRERLALENQQKRLVLANQTIEQTQAFIDKQIAAGKDPSSVQTALDAFRQAVTQTQGYTDTAAGLLAAPVGFDANGKVTDAQQARQTVREAGQALRQGHLALTAATIELRKAINAYAQSLKK